MLRAAAIVVTPNQAAVAEQVAVEGAERRVLKVEGVGYPPRIRSDAQGSVHGPLVTPCRSSPTTGASRTQPVEIGAKAAELNEEDRIETAEP